MNPLAERHVPLKGQPNFRDLGGYATGDGRRLKWGLVYRSGELSKLHEEDVERLEALGIRTVVDLRSRLEVDARGTGRLPDGVRRIEFPIDSGDLLPIILPGISSGDFSKIPPELLADINRRLVVERQAEFLGLLRAVADPANRPLVFHCTHGKDRAGLGAALILSVLGVAWETVLEDYLLTNRCRHAIDSKLLQKMRMIAAERRGIPPEQVDMTNAEALLVVRKSNLNAAREEVQRRYGSFGKYFREGLGWTTSEMEKLQEELLE